MTPSSAARPWVARFVADVVRVRAYVDFDDGTTREILNVGRRRAGVSGPVRYVGVNSMCTRCREKPARKGRGDE